MHLMSTSDKKRESVPDKLDLNRIYIFALYEYYVFESDGKSDDILHTMNEFDEKQVRLF